MRGLFRFLVGWWGSTAGSRLPGINTTAATMIQPSDYAATMVQPDDYAATEVAN